MAEHEAERVSTSPPAEGEHEHGAESGWKHWGLMALCCLPMIAIAVVVILGALGLR